MSENERWLPVVGFPGYEVSDLGRVRSFRISGGKGGIGCDPRILSLVKNPGGYPIVTLRAGGRTCTKRVHQLVLETFVGPRPFGMVARHFPDRDPVNARLDNLQWGTPKENASDRDAHGTTARGDRHGARCRLPPEQRRRLRAKPRVGLIVRGELHASAKLTRGAIAAAAARHAAGESFRVIAASLGVAGSTLQQAVRGITWAHLREGAEK